MFVAALFTIAKEWIKKMWGVCVCVYIYIHIVCVYICICVCVCIYTMYIYIKWNDSHKKNEIMLFVTTWMGHRGY